jgi:hypothetical protein
MLETEYVMVERDGKQRRTRNVTDYLADLRVEAGGKPSSGSSAANTPAPRAAPLVGISRSTAVRCTTSVHNEGRARAGTPFSRFQWILGVFGSGKRSRGRPAVHVGQAVVAAAVAVGEALVVEATASRIVACRSCTLTRSCTA